MPVDQDGNITTTPSVVAPTLKDVLNGGYDVLPLTLGGMVRIAKETTDADASVIVTNHTPVP